MSKFELEVTPNIDYKKLYGDIIEFVTENFDSNFEIYNGVISLDIDGNHGTFDLRKYITINNKFME